MKTNIPSSSPGGRGFSLVETTIAVGIAATVLVALVGLIPVSLDTLREASNTTAAARIIQSVSSDYRMRDWGEVIKQQEEGATRDYSFDGQGTRVKDGDSSTIFTARVTVASALPLPGQASSNPGLRSLLIQVTGSADPEAAFARPETCKQANSLLAQTDKVPAAPAVASN
ncbi:Verru_Chthon cassette protein B [Verrucomicrobium spinosum]|uniref:Verru_Chthon cassette protein B n=1 Tax=Verrucomicrobium spinosum TaxID=2736 RepID=UPI0001745E9D|nr:Verru_Chthon cassette protein B [Verrucomicrobium spinosum]